MKLYDEGLFWHGTDAGISVFPNYLGARQIALAAFHEGTNLDEVAHRSRHANGGVTSQSNGTIVLERTPLEAHDDITSALLLLQLAISCSVDPPPP